MRGHIEGVLHVSLGRQVVYLIWHHLIYGILHKMRICNISVMKGQLDPPLALCLLKVLLQGSKEWECRRVFACYPVNMVGEVTQCL
jgi:hypothetical protein